MSIGCDFLVVGAGISGAAAAAEMARHGRVIVLEAESRPGYHSTGRSAALFTPNYGNRLVRTLVGAGRSFFTAPPAGFSETPLLRPRGELAFAGANARLALDELLALSRPGDEIEEITPARALDLVPALRREAVVFAAYERGVWDMDVAAIHQGFLRGLSKRGGEVVCDARVEALDYRAGKWQATAGGKTYAAPVVVNAAGAWADELGRLAGARAIGLTPKRRTAVLVDGPADADCSAWPMVYELGLDRYECYFKAEAGTLMLSPGDATPTPPCDAAPEELDIAIAVDWLERVSHIRVRHLRRKWAGLRSFVADDAPVVGFDPDAEGFVWLAGQGGYGIMLSPTLGRAVAGLVTSGDLPADLRALGLSRDSLSPLRLAALVGAKATSQ
jgi:D-arginine dehydrogenase